MSNVIHNYVAVNSSLDVYFPESLAQASANFKRKIEEEEEWNGPISAVEKTARIASFENAFKLIHLRLPPKYSIYTETRQLNFSLNSGIILDEISPMMLESDRFYSNPSINHEWRPRLYIVGKLFYSNLIFSISIIPTEPREHQTIYFKKSYKIENNILPEEEVASLDSTKSFTTQNSCSFQTESSPQLIGFFKPYAGFSSNLAVPQYDPDHLPASIPTINIWEPAEVYSSLEGITNPDLPNQILRILDAFLEDIHAQGIALLILQPPHQTKVLYYKKFRILDESECDVSSS